VLLLHADLWCPLYVTFTGKLHLTSLRNHTHKKELEKYLQVLLLHAHFSCYAFVHYAAVLVAGVVCTVCCKHVEKCSKDAHADC